MANYYLAVMPDTHRHTQTHTDRQTDTHTATHHIFNIMPLKSDI